MTLAAFLEVAIPIALRLVSELADRRGISIDRDLSVRERQDLEAACRDLVAAKLAAEAGVAGAADTFRHARAAVLSFRAISPRDEAELDAILAAVS